MNVGTSIGYRDTERSQAMQILMVFNPKSGQRRLGRLRRTVARLKREGIQVNLQPTTARGDAERFAYEAGSGLNGFASLDLLAVAGGDGTINEAVNGLIAAAAGPGKALPLSIVPLGTANVLAREIGQAISSGAAAETALRGKARQVYL